MFDIDNHSKALSVKSVEDELYSNTSYVVEVINHIILNDASRISIKKTFRNNLTKLRFVIQKHEEFWIETKTKKVLSQNDSNFEYTHKTKKSFEKLKELCSDYHLKQLFLQQGWEIKLVKGTDVAERFFRSDLYGYTVTMIQTDLTNQPLVEKKDSNNLYR